MAKKKILIVEDEPHTLETLKDRLEFEGYEVITAQDGETAIMKAGREKPELITLDIMLPDMDGFAVCERLKKDTKTHFIPIIMLTVKDTVVEKVKGLDIGADDYVLKPFEDEELLARIRALLRVKELQDELDKSNIALKKINKELNVKTKELEQSNRELKKLDQLKSDFISTVSHELRTPLTSIREVTSQVLDGILGETTKEQREFLPIALSEIDRLGRIIEDLLDISKIESGKVELKKEVIDIVPLVKEVISSSVSEAKNKGLEIRENFPKEPIVVYADKDRIIQVFTNLVGNSIKFTEKGYIEISVVDKQTHVECSVSDTGKGISENDLPKVFSKFQQFGRTAGAGEKGTGLGLSIAKGIVELHDGKIWVESKLNKGTKFTFTLPKNTKGCKSP